MIAQEPKSTCPICQKAMATRVGMICAQCYFRALQRQVYRRSMRKYRD